MTVVGVGGVPKTVTKQTVILTYQPQQYATQVPINTKHLLKNSAIFLSAVFPTLLC